MTSAQRHHVITHGKVQGSNDYCSYIHQLERTPSIYDPGHKICDFFQRNTTGTHEELGSDHHKNTKSTPHLQTTVNTRIPRDNGIDAAAGDYIMHIHKRLEMEKLMSMKAH
ncbi:hypothetical protein AMTRI_Chr06g176540 [Amborella trichopoda]